MAAFFELIISNQVCLGMKKLLSFACAIAFFFIAPAQNINTSTSKVTFELSHMKFNSVEGTFNGMTGVVSFDPQDIEDATMSVCINASSVNTRNSKRDEHLRKEDFFNTEKYPEICFQSSRFETTESGYIVYGDLKMLDISKELMIPFKFENNIFQGSFIIQRLDYGLGEDTGTFMVGNDVEMSIICELKSLRESE